jgi:hypothetical protein
MGHFRKRPVAVVKQTLSTYCYLPRQLAELRHFLQAAPNFLLDWNTIEALVHLLFIEGVIPLDGALSKKTLGLW